MQINVEDTRLVVAEYIIDKHKIETIELKLCHGAKCIGCEVCFVACNDGAHQCIDLRPGSRVPRVRACDCVGCNLCALVCPVDGCISMKTVETGLKPLTWEQYAAAGMKGYRRGRRKRRHAS